MRTIRSCEKGAKNIANLYKFVDNVQQCEEIISKDILNEVVGELYANTRPHGDLPIWVYLLRYERHAFYPKTTIGIFMDIVNIVCNFIKKHEVDEEEARGTSVFAILESMPAETNSSNKIIDFLNEKAKPFVDTIKESEPRINFLKAASTYLWLRYHYEDGLKYEEEIAKRIRDKEGMLATYMLGLVFGHDKTYECLYNSLPLSIYKSDEEMEAIHKKLEDDRIRAAKEMSRMEDETKRQAQERRGFGKTGGCYGGCATSNKGVVSNTRKKTSGEHSFREVGNISVSEPALRSNASVSNQNLGGVLFPNEDLSRPEIPPLPCTMYKFKKGTKTEVCRNSNPKTVNAEDEYLKLYKKGWRVEEKL